MAFASGTLVQVSEKQVEEIQNLKMEDLISVYDMDEGNPIYDGKTKIAFINGTAEGSHTVLNVRFTIADNPLQLICTPDQLFLMADGSLKRGRHIVPMEDEVFAMSGQKIPIESIRIGLYKGILHDLSANTGPSHEINGNLIGLNGLVCGDYSLELGQP